MISVQTMMVMDMQLEFAASESAYDGVKVFGQVRRQVAGAKRGPLNGLQKLLRVHSPAAELSSVLAQNAGDIEIRVKRNK